MTKKKLVEPSIYKTEAWKTIEKELGKMPKFRVSAGILSNKEDAKKAKLMERLLNYQFKQNVGMVRTRYYKLQKRLAEAYAKEMLYGIKVRWEDMESWLQPISPK